MSYSFDFLTVWLQHSETLFRPMRLGFFFCKLGSLGVGRKRWKLVHEWSQDTAWAQFLTQGLGLTPQSSNFGLSLGYTVTKTLLGKSIVPCTKQNSDVWGNPHYIDAHGLCDTWSPFLPWHLFQMVQPYVINSSNVTTGNKQNTAKPWFKKRQTQVCSLLMMWTMTVIYRSKGKPLNMAKHARFLSPHIVF